MSEYRTEAEAVAHIAYAASEAETLDPGVIYAHTDTDGSYTVFDTDAYAQHPRCKTGADRVTNVEHFIAYLAKHANPDTELWGNTTRGTVKAVINAHGPNGAPAGWGDHTAELSLTCTNDWADWSCIDRQWMSQADFAEHVEDHLANFLAPTAADMLELAQHFKANRSVEFEAGHRTKSGATTLVYRETDKARAGVKGDLEIPDRLELKIAPWRGFNEYKVDARFRYRITNGQLAMSVALERPHDILDAAFEHVTKQIEEETGHQIWHTP